MNDYHYEEPVSTFDLREALWGLLGQWKAVLIVALVAAALVPAAKLVLDKRTYSKDLAEYQAAVEKMESTKKDLEGLSGNEQRKVAMSDLSDEERATLEHLARLEEVEAVQAEYLENSILMQVDATNQRTLTLKYVLTRNGDFDLVPLAEAYTGTTVREDVASRVGEVVSPGTDVRFIYELIGIGTGAIPDSDAREVTLSVNVTLPEGADADVVEGVVSDALRRSRDEYSASIGAHDLTLTYRDVIHRYNKGTADSKLKLTNELASTRKSIADIRANLTDEQKVAMYGISYLQKEQQEAEEAKAAADATSAAAESEDESELKEPVAPSFNVTFVAVGFALGVFGYAFVYLVVCALRGTVGSPAGLDGLTGCRLLGDVRYPVERKGLAALFHSKWVDGMRYRGLGDVDEQIGRVAATALPVCEHAGATSLSLLTLFGGREAPSGLAGKLSSALGERGISCELVDPIAEGGEEALLGKGDALLLVDGSCRYDDVCRQAALARSYDVRALGVVYFGEQ